MYAYKKICICHDTSIHIFYTSYMFILVQYTYITWHTYIHTTYIHTYDFMASYFIIYTIPSTWHTKLRRCTWRYTYIHVYICMNVCEVMYVPKVCHVCMYVCTVCMYECMNVCTTYIHEFLPDTITFL